MKLTICITISCCLSLGFLGGCSLYKSTKQSTANTSSQLNNTKDAHTSVAPVTTPGQSDIQPTGTPNKSAEVADELHTPEKGSTERQAIMDALRDGQQVQFQVNYLKVHNGWCWVDTTPLDKNGRATAEGGANLLHLENGKWRVMNLSKVPEDPADPMGPDDPSPNYIKNVLKTFPGVPRDILPKPSN